MVVSGYNRFNIYMKATYRPLGVRCMNEIFISYAPILRGGKEGKLLFVVSGKAKYAMQIPRTFQPFRGIYMVYIGDFRL
jgi:hypothetical protein